MTPTPSLLSEHVTDRMLPKLKLAYNVFRCTAEQGVLNTPSLSIACLEEFCLHVKPDRSLRSLVCMQ